MAASLEAPILGAALTKETLAVQRDWILEKQRDLEIQDFFSSETLDGDWRSVGAEIRRLLDGYTGRLGIHGPFWGFKIDSQDPLIRAVVTKRLLQGLEVCEFVGATQMVIHSPFTTWDYNNLDINPGSRHALTERVHLTLKDVVRRAENIGCELVIENIEDKDPTARVLLMWALKTLEAFGRSGMPNLGLGQARQSFVAGNIAISADSTSYVAAAERQIGGRFQFKTVAFPLAVADGRLPAGGNVAMVFAKDAERQKAAWKYVKFTTGPVGQTAMVNSTGYMPGNEIAVKTPDLLGAFYARSPNHLTSIQQLPLLTEWASFPGDNSLKIIEVIKHHMESLVTGKRTAEQVVPELVGDVSNLLPKCGG